jgi:hypothetical protein
MRRAAPLLAALIPLLGTLTGSSTALAQTATPETGEAAAAAPEADAPRGAVTQAELAEASAAEAPPAAAQAPQPVSTGAPMSDWGFGGPQPGRIAIAVGGGWPAAWLELDYGATRRLGLGLRAGYFYGNPHGGIGLASGVLVQIPTRIGLLRRERLELSLEVTAGVDVALDSRLSLATDDPSTEDEFEGLLPSDRVFPLATNLGVGLMVSLTLRPTLVLKLGFEIPARLVLVMADRPYDDAWELSVPFAFRAGVVWRAVRWLGLFAVADVGPSLVVVPSAWTSDGYDHGVEADVYLRASAGVTFAPWP